MNDLSCRRMVAFETNHFQPRMYQAISVTIHRDYIYRILGHHSESNSHGTLPETPLYVFPVTVWRVGGCDHKSIIHSTGKGQKLDYERRCHYGL